MNWIKKHFLWVIVGLAVIALFYFKFKNDILDNYRYVEVSGGTDSPSNVYPFVVAPKGNTA